MLQLLQATEVRRVCSHDQVFQFCLWWEIISCWCRGPCLTKPSVLCVRACGCVHFSSRRPIKRTFDSLVVVTIVVVLVAAIVVAVITVRGRRNIIHKFTSSSNSSRLCVCLSRNTRMSNSVSVFDCLFPSVLPTVYNAGLNESERGVCYSRRQCACTPGPQTIAQRK